MTLQAAPTQHATTATVTLMDRKSSLHRKGVVLHCKGVPQDRGCRFHNPNASPTCGCGISFPV